MIIVENVSKKYGSQEVLVNVNVKFSPGIIHGLVGANGCGKTTLMRIICGFTKPTSGKVKVLGKVVGKDVDFAPSTGIIIEAPGFLPHYSGIRNLQILAGVSRKVSPDRLHEVMKWVGLDSAMRKPVGKYSLGMRQRLGIAQAIMENPDVLILDEPFNGLDKDAMDDIRNLFQTLKSQGKTIILVSHYAQEIVANCDVVYEISKGSLSTKKAE